MSRNYSEIWPELEAAVLTDADNVVTELGLWNWLKETSWDKISSGDNFNKIMHKLKVSDSINFVLKNLQDVAQNGWEAHCRLRKMKQQRQEILERLQNLCLEGKMSHEDFVKIRDTA